jgi:hypothetical protein
MLGVLCVLGKRDDVVGFGQFAASIPDAVGMSKVSLGIDIYLGADDCGYLQISIVA